MRDEREAADQTRVAAGPMLDRRMWLQLAGASGVLLSAPLAQSGCRNQDEATRESDVALAGRVVSHSMAPRFAGPHLVAACTCCEWATKIGVPIVDEAEDGSEPWVCPQCGSLQTLPDSPSIQPGERVRLESLDAAAGTRQLKRFDIVAIQTSNESSNGDAAAELATEEPNEWILKRILGLPGETIETRGGDLWIDQQIARKSLTDLHAMKILVHEDRGLPEGCDARIGWRDDEGAWSRRDGRWECRGREDELAWSRLTFQSARCVVTPMGPAQPAPIEDTLSYSQHRPRRLNAVSDIALSATLTHAETMSFRCGLHAGLGWVIVEFDALNRVVNAQLFDTVHPSPLPLSFPNLGDTIFVSAADRQLSVQIADDEAIQIPFPTIDYAQDKSQFLDRPCYLEVLGSGSFGDLRVWRDQYWTGPNGDESYWSFPSRLGDGEYFLVGDNMADSIDCRHSGVAIQRSQIRARVVI